MTSPLVSVIIGHHLDINRKYLEVCVKSYLNSINIDFEVIVLSDAQTDPSTYLPSNENLRIYWDKSLSSYKRKIDRGYELMHPQSKYLFISNDDILVNKHSLVLMTEWVLNTNCIINGLSNSDNKAIWFGNMTIALPEGDSLTIENMVSLEDLKGKEEFLMNMDPIPGARILFFQQDWMPMFATCMSKEVWEKVGPLDEELDTYGNDVDWCLRAKDLKYRCAIDPTALIIHFQHKTLEVTKRHEVIEKSKIHLMNKRKKAMGIV